MRPSGDRLERLDRYQRDLERTRRARVNRELRREFKVAGLAASIGLGAMAAAALMLKISLWLAHGLR